MLNNSLRLIGSRFYFVETDTSFTLIKKVLSELETELDFKVSAAVFNDEEGSLEPELRKLQDKNSFKTGIIIRGQNNIDSLIFSKVKNNLYCISMVADENSLSVERIIDRLVVIEGLVIGFEFNENDRRRQSENSIDVYKRMGYDTTKLKLVLNKFQRRVVDIRSNFGRSIEYEGMIIIAAWKIWYSLSSKQKFPIIARIDSYLNYYSRINLEGNVVAVQLFESLFLENYESVNRFQQKDFLDYLRLSDSQ